MSNSPGLDGIIVSHSGSKLLGVLYRAGGASLHPTVLLLHGLPGLEKNTDIAYALRDAGWNTLIFHYRGCWGSEGDYTLAGIPDDVQAALDTLASGELPVDPSRIVAVGHNLGGWAAIVAASHDPRIHGLATLGGISNLRTVSLSDEVAADYARCLRNISGRGIQSQWRALGATYNPVDLMGLLQPCPLLIVHGTADEIVPVSQAMELKAKAPAAEVVLVEGADHAFSRHRRLLVDTVVQWVTSKL